MTYVPGALSSSKGGDADGDVRRVEGAKAVATEDERPDYRCGSASLDRAGARVTQAGDDRSSGLRSDPSSSDVGGALNDLRSTATILRR